MKEINNFGPISQKVQFVLFDINTIKSLFFHTIFHLAKANQIDKGKAVANSVRLLPALTQKGHRQVWWGELKRLQATVCLLTKFRKEVEFQILEDVLLVFLTNTIAHLLEEKQTSKQLNGNRLRLS
jgi:hypothetical protein